MHETKWLPNHVYLLISDNAKKHTSIHEVKTGLSRHPNHISSCRLVFLCWTLSSLNAAKKTTKKGNSDAAVIPLPTTEQTNRQMCRAEVGTFKVQQQKTILPKSTARDKKTTERKRISKLVFYTQRKRERAGAGGQGSEGGGREVGRGRERWGGGKKERERASEGERERMCAYK